MMWLTWRQHRGQAVTTAAAVVALSGLLLFVGRAAYTTFLDSGLERCLATSSTSACEAMERVFDARHSSAQFVLILILFCPLLLGVFWGAPLVARELENGTHRFGWTQGVSRLRWLTPKLLFAIAVTAAAALALAAASSWLSHPFNEVFSARQSHGVFDVQGVVPVAYSVFALSLGLAAGAVFRRVLPAMAATAAGFVVVRAVVEFIVRPRLLPTSIVSYPTELGRPPGARGDFVVSERVLTSTGEEFSRGFDITIGPSTVANWCPEMVTGDMPSIETVDACIASLGLRTVETVHPASQFWTFQALESAIFILMAAALVLAAAWQIRKRLGA